MTTPVSADDHAAAIATEYSKWVAVEQIRDGNALAFNVGDPVPVEHVEQNKVPRSSVKGVGTKAAAAAVSDKG